MTALTSLGARLSRHTLVYSSGSFVTLVLSIVNVAVLTRLLTPTEFAHLAILLVFAGLLTIVYNAGSLQGAFTWIYGASGDDDAGDDGVDESKVAAQKSRALGTALAFTVLLMVAGTALAAVFAKPLGDVLVGGDDLAIVMAAASGGLGAVWRLVANVPRMERRPARFVVLNSARPILVIGATIPLVAAGLGVRGALLGTAAGTAVAIVVAIALSAPSYATALDRQDLATMMKKGSVYIPVIVAFWVIHNVDLYMLSRYAPADDVALYRVATRFAAALSYFVSAYLMAWVPLTQTAVYFAAHREKGVRGVGAPVVTYWTLASMGLLLGLAVCSDVVVRVAAPSYASAAPLIPVLGLAFVAYGTLMVIHRSTAFPKRRAWYIGTSVCAALVFVGAALLLIPPFGSYGAAIAPMIAFVFAILVLWARSQFGPTPLPFEYGRMAAGVALAVACYGVAEWLGPLAGDWRPAVAAAALIAYPALLAVSGVIPRRHLRPLAEIARAMLPQWGTRGRARELVRRLPEADRDLLAAVTRNGRSPREIAGTFAASEREICERTVRALRALNGNDAPADDEAAIGEYLLSTEPPADRDAHLRRLRREGIDPLEIDSLERTLALVGRASPRRRRAQDDTRVVHQS